MFYKDSIKINKGIIISQVHILMEKYRDKNFFRFKTYYQIGLAETRNQLGRHLLE